MRPRLLVVDDSPPLRRFVERLLGDELEVESVADGWEAIQQLSGGKTYDVLLVDLAMPTVNGRQLYDVIRRRFPDLLDRIVFLTGGAVSEEDHRFLRRVPNDVVQKPFDNDVLREVVRKAAGLTT
jgi:two-component system cell cycle sensor histidine kinase/response regulator CckA